MATRIDNYVCIYGWKKTRDIGTGTFGKQVLDGKKSIDIFQCARVDTTVPIQETVAILAKYVHEGKIGGIGLSEPDATTIRQAHEIHPIAGVEVEMSLWSTDILTNGVAATCGALGIPIIAHSPLGHGFLTGKITRPGDIPHGDIREHLARFQQGALERNLERVYEIQALAKKKGCTEAQLALAWVRSFSEREGFPVVVPIPGATREERMTENAVIVQLDDDDLGMLDNILARTEVIGGRYM